MCSCVSEMSKLVASKQSRQGLSVAETFSQQAGVPVRSNRMPINSSDLAVLAFVTVRRYTCSRVLDSETKVCMVGLYPNI